MPFVHVRPLAPALALFATLVATEARAGAIDDVASELGATVAAALPRMGTTSSTPPSILVLTSEPSGEVLVDKRVRLRDRLGQSVAARLGPRARAEGRPSGTLAAAMRHAKRYDYLVSLSPVVERGKLRLSADVLAVPSSSWQRMRPPPPPLKSTFALASVDAELRSFLPPVDLERASVHKYPSPAGPVLSLACGTLPDGGLGVAYVTSEVVGTGRFALGRFEPLTSANWVDLRPRAPVPLREPLATALFFGGSLWVGHSDRGGVQLDDALRVRHSLPQMPVSVPGGVACAALSPLTGGFGGSLVDCSQPLRIVHPSLTARFDTVVGGNGTSPDGRVYGVEAARESTGRLLIRVDGRNRTIDGLGTAVAVGDLDQDGVTEVVASLDGPLDELRVYSLSADPPKLRRALPARAGVAAVAICPPEERSVPAVVAAVGRELWLVR